MLITTLSAIEGIVEMSVMSAAVGATRVLKSSIPSLKLGGITTSTSPWPSDEVENRCITAFQEAFGVESFIRHWAREATNQEKACAALCNALQASRRAT
eukprot:scaffold75271_cov15-Tisochrysis_lutea.AAC.1